MLNRTTAFKQAAEKANSKPVFSVAVTKTTLFAQVRNQADWNAGDQEGTAPNDLLNGAHTDSVTTITVDDTSDFSVPDPTVTTGHTIAYLELTDGTDKEIVSYTGTTATTFTGVTRAQYGTTAQTWADNDTVNQVEFDNAGGTTFDLGITKRHWRELESTGAPTPLRVGSSVVYDINDDLYLMFGGENISGGTPFNNDIWKFDPSNNTWTEFTSASGTPPTARRDHMSVWDSNRDVMIVHGGQDASIDYQDTFEFDPAAGGGAGSWTAKDNGPNDRFNAACAFDSVNNVMHIVSGEALPSSKRRDAYQFDGAAASSSQWTQTSTETGPEALQVSGTGEMIGSRLVFYNGVRAIIYDTAAGTWELGAAQSLVSEAATVDPISQRLIIPGNGTPPTTQAFYYDVPLDQWFRTTDNPNAGPRAGGAACWNSTNNEAFFWSGGGAGIDVDNPIIFQWHHQSMQWRSGTIDLGMVPTDDGVITIEDTTPLTGDASITVTLQNSTDDITYADFNSGNPVPSGTILDDLKRYWQATVVLTTDTSDTPLVQRIRLSFGEKFFMTLADNPALGFVPIVKNIPNLSTKLDPLKGTASISELKVQILNEDGGLEGLIKSDNIYNNTIEIKMGFDEPGFTEDDYLPYLTGRVNDWDIDRNILTIKARDNLEVLKTEIPEAIGTALPIGIAYNVGTISHPIAIQTDIITNQVNLSDEFIDADSFTACENDATLSGWNFFRTLSEPTPAKKFLEEISRLTNAVIIPSEDGRIRCKIYDPTDEVATTWDERHILVNSVKFELQSDKIKNFIATYYDGDGTSASDFNGVDVQSDATSIITWNDTLVEKIFSNWLGASGATYEGEIRSADIGERILERYQDSVPQITLETGLDQYHIQIADLVFITGGSLIEDYTIPYVSLDFDLVRLLKFQVVQKTVMVNSGKIKWVLWRAPTTEEVLLASQTHWEDGGINFSIMDSENIDTTTTPGDIQLDATGITAGFGCTSIKVELNQQPERNWTILAGKTEPSNTSTDMDVWGSHTGEFTGEEELLAIGITLPVGATIITENKFRFYRIRLNLRNTDATSTPSIQNILAVF